MSRKYRRVLAAVLTAVMVLGSAMAADAANGRGQGSGSLDIVKYPDVFSAILPTNVGGQFNYILDPTGILVQVGADKYGNATFEPDKTMYFRHKPASGSDVANYTDVSEPITAYNRSNIDVEIKIQAKLDIPKGITLASSSVVNDTSTDPKMYMAVTEGSKNTEKPVTSQGIEVVAPISSTKAKAHYETVYDARNDMYKNQLDHEASNAAEAEYGKYFDSYSFMLTGDCNRTGDWNKLKDTPPAIRLVWTIDKTQGSATGIPSIPDGPDVPDVPVAPGQVSVSLSDDGIIWVKGLTSAANYGGEVTLTYDGQTSQNLDSEYDIEWEGVGTTWTSDKGGTLGIRLSQTWLNIVKGKSVTATVRLTDGSKVTATHQF